MKKVLTPVLKCAIMILSNEEREVFELGKKKEFFLVIDTETANGLEQPIPYDIGYAITDRQGHIYLERSFVVSEIFLDYPEMMSSSYYADKIPYYWDDIKNGKRILKSIFNIKKIIKQDMKNFNVKKVGAYNMAFDKRSLNNGIRYCSKSFFRWFFPFGTEFFCIWSMACQTILDSASYVKFAIENKFISEVGNLLTNAQCCYAFLKRDPDFSESHTGLEDVKIEIEIMAKCFATHKKMDKKINPACWRIPQKRYKEMAPHYRK